MPQEVRYIMFRNEEVVQAVESYMRRMGMPLPAGSIMSCTTEQDEALKSTWFRITLAPDITSYNKLDRTVHRDVIVADSNLAAALILHCRRVGIPLPAKAEKSLRIAGGQLCLVVATPVKEGVVDLRRLRTMLEYE